MEKLLDFIVTRIMTLSNQSDYCQDDVECYRMGSTIVELNTVKDYLQSESSFVYEEALFYLNSRLLNLDLNSCADSLSITMPATYYQIKSMRNELGFIRDELLAFEDA